jgi:hypothetical protein
MSALIEFYIYMTLYGFAVCGTLFVVWEMFTNEHDIAEITDCEEV